MTSDSSRVPGWFRDAQQALHARDFRRAHALAIAALQRDGNKAAAQFVLAVVAAEHDNFRKAAELLQSAVGTDPNQADYYAQWARCLIATQQPAAALAAARAGLALSPTDPYTLDTLGVALTRAGAHDEAVAPFRAAVVRAPHTPTYQYNLGAALQFVGDFAGSSQAFRAALELDPAQHRAWSALAQVSKAGLNADEVEQCTAQLARPDLEVDAELHLCHALAKQAEDQGDFATSMAWLQRGKKRKRAQLGYQPETDAALFAAAINSSASLASTAGHHSAEPIFIVGMPRTGTTLVERILSSHPQVFAAGELSHFSLALKRACGTPGAHVLDAQTLAAAASGIDLAAVGRAYVASTRPRTGHTARFIDKMPLNVFYAGLIRAALPNARIICLRRHPLDTCLSNYRQLFATGFSYYNYAYDLLDCGRYWQGFDALCRHWSATLGAGYTEVHYEAVVADLETQARRLVAFCGLDWDPACIAFHRNAAPVATASSVQVREPLYRRAVGRWQKYGSALAPLQALLADAVAQWPDVTESVLDDVRGD